MTAIVNRRDFLAALASGATALAAGTPREKKELFMPNEHGERVARISLVRTNNRKSGIKRAIDLLGENPIKGQDVLLKPNFNTADPYPGSTHNDTLEQLILHIWRMGAKSVTIGERSGPPDTEQVIREKGVDQLCKKLDVAVLNFEDLPASDWVRVIPPKSTWRNGFEVARPVLESPCTVTTCCLKTHAYGGIFTLSLKLSVGITRKSNMAELHASFLSMRKMIAEINYAYTPALVVLDGIEAFTDGGPAHGTKKQGGVIIAGTDRIAIDATGLAVLQDLGSNHDIMETRIFDQEQINRAVELGLGISRPEQIEIVSDDDEGRTYADRLRTILRQG
jgi:uncharacterized protein (DUF362 family)